MAKDKRRRIKMLLELEKLTDKENHSDDDKYLIDYYRKELGVEKQTNEPKFILERYLKLVKDMPNATDAERAKVMDISKNQLCCGKRRHKLIGLKVEDLLKMA